MIKSSRCYNAYCIGSIAVIGCALLIEYLLVLYMLYYHDIQFKPISNWKDVKPYKGNIALITTFKEFPYQNITCRHPSYDAYYGYIFEYSDWYKGEPAYVFLAFYCREGHNNVVWHLTTSLIQSISVSIKNASLEELVVLKNKITTGNATYYKLIYGDVSRILHGL